MGQLAATFAWAQWCALGPSSNSACCGSGLVWHGYQDLHRFLCHTQTTTDYWQSDAAFHLCLKSPDEVPELNPPKLTTEG